MQYKRFSTGNNKGAVPTFEPPAAASIAESVSTIEIGNAATVEFVAPYRRARRYGRIFRAFLLLSVLGLIAAPFTSGGKRALDIACGLLTADETVLSARIHSFVLLLSANEGTSEKVGTTSSGKTEFSENFFTPASAVSSLSRETDDTALSASSETLPAEENFPVQNVPETIPNLINETAYSVDFTALSALPYPIPALAKEENGKEAVDVFGESAPDVLILHTHGTECYADAQNAAHYRTQDTAQNVVAVGKVLAESLAEEGISVIHCEEMFDKDSFIKAYSASARAVRDYQERYPSIRYIIDLHRDAIPDGNGYADLSTEIEGEKLARLMLVIGTDEAGAEHPEWKQNLRVAQSILSRTEEDYPTLMRGINLRRASFNQQLSNGYFLLEAGSCGGTLEEAQKSVRLFAKAFSSVIKG